MTARDRTICWSWALVVALAGFWFLAIKPKHAESKSLAAQVDQAADAPAAARRRRLPPASRRRRTTPTTRRRSPSSARPSRPTRTSPRCCTSCRTSRHNAKSRLRLDQSAPRPRRGSTSTSTGTSTPAGDRRDRRAAAGHRRRDRGPRDAPFSLNVQRVVLRPAALRRGRPDVRPGQGRPRERRRPPADDRRHRADARRRGLKHLEADVIATAYLSPSTAPGSASTTPSTGTTTTPDSGATAANPAPTSRRDRRRKQLMIIPPTPSSVTWSTAGSGRWRSCSPSRSPPSRVLGRAAATRPPRAAAGRAVRAPAPHGREKAEVTLDASVPADRDRAADVRNPFKSPIKVDDDRAEATLPTDSGSTGPATRRATTGAVERRHHDRPAPTTAGIDVRLGLATSSSSDTSSRDDGHHDADDEPSRRPRRPRPPRTRPTPTTCPSASALDGGKLTTIRDVARLSPLPVRHRPVLRLPRRAQGRRRRTRSARCSSSPPTRRRTARARATRRSRTARRSS